MILVVSILLLFKSKIASGCKYTTERGTFDLTPIAATNYPTPGPAGDHYYDFTFCHNSADDSLCKDSHAGVCAIQRESESATNQNCYSLGTWENSVKPTSTADGFSIEFDDGQSDWCPDKGPRTVTFVFTCNDAVEVGVITIAEPGRICGYEVTVPTKYVCDDHIVPGGSGGSGGLSDGSLFLIVLLALVVFYCIGGYGFKKFKFSAEGLEAFPQASFWCTQLPFWVKTGFMVSWAFILGLFSRIRAKITGVPVNRGREDTDGDGTYENLD